DEDGRAGPEECGQIDLGLLPCRREPDQDDRAAARDQAERLLERAAAADDVEDVIGGTRLRVGRAETSRLLELALVDVERPDLGCPGDPRALDHGEADGAAA